MVTVTSIVHPLPNGKILDWSKLETFADDSKIAKMIIFVFDKVENVVTSIFTFSHNVFRRPFTQGKELRKYVQLDCQPKVLHLNCDKYESVSKQNHDN